MHCGGGLRHRLLRPGGFYQRGGVQHLGQATCSDVVGIQVLGLEYQAQCFMVRRLPKRRIARWVCILQREVKAGRLVPLRCIPAREQSHLRSGLAQHRKATGRAIAPQQCVYRQVALHMQLALAQQGAVHLGIAHHQRMHGGARWFSRAGRGVPAARQCPLQSQMAVHPQQGTVGVGRTAIQRGGGQGGQPLPVARQGGDQIKRRHVQVPLHPPHRQRDPALGRLLQALRQPAGGRQPVGQRCQGGEIDRGKCHGAKAVFRSEGAS